MNLEPLRELDADLRKRSDDYAKQSKEVLVRTDSWYLLGAAEALARSADDLSRALAQLDDGWRPIAEAPQQRKVLLGYNNKLGNWRTVIGIFYPENTLEIDEFAGDWDDYEEFAPAGWYECSETHEHIHMTDEPPTHFRPLPSPPAQTQEPER